MPWIPQVSQNFLFLGSNSLKLYSLLIWIILASSHLRLDHFWFPVHVRPVNGWLTDVSAALASLFYFEGHNRPLDQTTSWSTHSSDEHMNTYIHIDDTEHAPPTAWALSGVIDQREQHSWQAPTHIDITIIEQQRKVESKSLSSSKY